MTLRSHQAATCRVFDAEHDKAASGASWAKGGTAGEGLGLVGGGRGGVREIRAKVYPVAPQVVRDHHFDHAIRRAIFGLRPLGGFLHERFIEEIREILAVGHGLSIRHFYPRLQYIAFYH